MTAPYIVRITNGIFKESLVKTAKPIFQNPIKNFQINPNEKWILWGPGKVKMMNILSSKYLSETPLSLKYGLTHDPKIETVQFKGAIPTAHLSARYEFYKDEYDQTCKQFILGDSIGSQFVNYKVSTSNRKINMKLYEKLIKELNLVELQDRWAMGLSNGQMRRARLANSLLKEPDLLLVDDPFLGLDPKATSIISKLLSNYNAPTVEHTSSVRGCPVVIGLRYQDPLPSWATHLCCVDEQLGILFQGPIKEVQNKIDQIRKQEQEILKKQILNEENSYTVNDLVAMHPLYGKSKHEVIKMPHTLELKGLNVSYKGEPVLQSLHWEVQPGSKWHIRGDNGSGKSTLLSLITAEHPQSWNSKVVENGIERRSGNANYFDINKKIGMSSPELHAILLKNVGDKLNVLECISTGFHEGPNNFLPMWSKLNENQKKLVDMYISYFGLTSIINKSFKELSVSEQKLILFIRGLIKMPEVLILDEAFSAMEIEPMIQCQEFLEHWPGTVFVVAHVEEETPKCDHYLRLIKPGEYTIGDIDNN
ncbi:uncharacterized protein NDAI_0A03750 [Naumovozyma dairenensis CBS 421]|uniref:ABC transporter domain-containing protein n=1 Tax=Naumovozyma dairenensis (strain ATCC 10597 / BCRC 20456 / CBS 421 / NBRC 0211 / NRRL Y-12639) TaxID=1071378 RepID=G0W3Z4_NAUDC|nr:hypothetical protein NDAI_0A03750 [Naumovozyma dairenensis CBS 421]CCD22532.1 hypothetical protein NDAI_0A03750 [Naumovozyma dairenensis CBS 421]